MMRAREGCVHLGPVAHELSVRHVRSAPDERHVFHAGGVLTVGPGPLPCDDLARVDPEHIHLPGERVELVPRGKVVEVLGAGETERDQRVARWTGELAEYMRRARFCRICWHAVTDICCRPCQPPAF